MSYYFYMSEYEKVTMYHDDKKPQCNNEQCVDENAYCSGLVCKCNKHYEYNDSNITCVPCPGYQLPCKDCCKPGLFCKESLCECEDLSYCPGPQSGVFVTASQIALSAALIMGIAALAMVIYRLCTKPKYQTARQRAERRMISGNLNDDNSFNHLRESLSSMQIRILTRLRDRPPPYQNEQPPSIIGQNPENPPSYYCGRDIESHLPPPYNEVILSPAEYLNQAFENTEQSTISTNANTETSTVNKNNPKNDTSSVKNTDNNSDSSYSDNK